MEKAKGVFLGILIGTIIYGLCFGIYQIVIMYKAIAYVQADIRGIDYFLKYQVDNGKLLALPQQETKTTPAQ